MKQRTGRKNDSSRSKSGNSRFSKSKGAPKRGRSKSDASPFRKKREDGDKKPFDRERAPRGAGSSSSSERKPFRGRPDGDNEKKSFSGSRERSGSFDRGKGGKRPYTKRDSSVAFDKDKGGKRPYAKREDSGEERKSFSSPRERSTGFRGKSGGDRPYKRRDDDAGERKSFGGVREERGSRDGERAPRSSDGDRPKTYLRSKPDSSRGDDNFKKEERVPRDRKPAAEGGFTERRRRTTNDETRGREERPFERGGEERRERSSYKPKESGDRKWNRKEKHEFYGDKKKRPSKSFSDKPDDGTVRLNKFIANAGICSRREADELIAAGVVSVNGEVITEMGYKVKPDDNVKYNNELLKTERQVYILLNKPKDFITTTDDPEDRKTVMSLIAKAGRERVYPVGRLDRNTTGVLLFTNDGDLAKKLTHPSFEVFKVYQVELDRALKGADFDQVKEGLKLEDGFIKADEIVYTTADKDVVGIEIHSGKNRIVRRIFEHLGYEVKKLDRVVFAGLTKKDLPRGRWRFLTELEIANLKMMTGKKAAAMEVKARKQKDEV